MRSLVPQFCAWFLLAGAAPIAAFGAGEVAPGFTLDGTLYDSPAGTSTLHDTAVVRVQVLNPAKTCVLYDEQQTVNTVASDGAFSIQVGSAVGSGRRVAGSDSANTMVQVFQNKDAITGNNGGCSYTPVAGDIRYARVFVTPAGTGVTDQLSPDMTVGSVPAALVADSLQGVSRNGFLQLGAGALTQANVETVFTTANFSALSALLSGGGASSSGNYVIDAGTGGSGGIDFNVNGSTKANIANNGNFNVDSGSLFVEASSNRVGIGTTAPAASLDLSQRSDAIVLPAGTTAQRPSPAMAGMVRFNASLAKMEFHDGTGWATIGTDVSGISAGGDLSGTYPNPTVARLQGTAVSSGAPNSGEFLKYNGTNWAGAAVKMSDLKNATGSALFSSPGCTAAQSLYWDSGTDTIKCQSIGSLAASVIASGTIDSARLPAGASVWDTATGGINYAGGRVGIGTTAPGHALDVNGDLNTNSWYRANSISVLRNTSGTTTLRSTGSMNFLVGASGGVTAATFDSSGNLGIGTTAVTAGTILDVNGTGTNSAMMLPRDTTTNRPATGVAGMIRYNTTTNQIELYNGTTWTSPAQTASPTFTSLVNVSASNGTAYLAADPSNAMPLAANVGLNMNNGTGSDGAGTFIRLGSTNTAGTSQRALIGASSQATGSSPAIVFGQQTAASTYAERMRIDLNGNLGIGSTSPQAKLDVNGGIAIGGSNAISFPPDFTPQLSVAVGKSALASQAAAGIASQNTAIGALSMSHASFSGNQNTAVGYGTLMGNTSGVKNVAIGHSALSTNTTGQQNVGLGTYTLLLNTTGQANMAIGHSSLSSNTVGSNNVGIGLYSGQKTTGSNNTYIGFWAGQSITSGANNVVIGANVANTTLTTGSNNILIGSHAGVDTAAAASSNTLNIGNLIYGTGLVSSGTTPGGNVGIGTAAPDTKLHLVGTSGTTLKIVDGNQGAGKVLASDANGVASWTTVAGVGNAFTNAGNAFGGDATIGLTDAYALLFKVNNAESMRIRGNGKVGIAQTLPTGTLHVGSGSGASTNAATVVVENNGSSSGAHVFQVATAASTTPVFNVTNAGTVGIGTSAPGAKLHVAGGNISISQTGATAITSFNDGSVFAYNGVVTGSGYYAGTTSGNPLVLLTNNAEQLRITSAGNVGIGSSSPGAKLDVTGNINASGSVSSNGIALSSDLRWKKDIEPLRDSLRKLLRLRGVSYHWRQDDFPEKHFGSEKQVGLIAQDVEKEFPEVVLTDRAGYKAVNYPALVGPVVEAVRELYAHLTQVDARTRAENTELKARASKLEQENAELKARMNRLEHLLLTKQP